MKINIVSVYTQKIGQKNYFWGQDDRDHIYLLNNYPQLSESLNLHSNFEQLPDQILRSIKLKNDQIIQIPRSEISRITCSSYNIN